MIKPLLLVFLFSACSLFGILKAYAVSSRFSNLEKIKSVFSMIKSELYFSKKDVYSVFEEIFESDETGISEYMTNRTFSPEENYFYAKSKIGKGLFLDNYDWKIIDGFFCSLGKSDFENQKESMEKSSELLEKIMISAEEEKRKYSKLYASCGVLTGLFLVIILL